MIKEIMQKIAPLQKEIKKLQNQQEDLKVKISEIIKNELIQALGKVKKFQFEENWYQVKKRSGRFFLVNFHKTEPGSWRRIKKQKEEES